MDKKIKLQVYTFLGVGLIVFLIGYWGTNLSLKYIQKHYIQLQIDVNKRQAERMAFFLEREIQRGIPLDSIRDEFQASIVGTEYDKGFLCMYDTREKQLVCHPDAKAVGMMFTKKFIFKDINTNASTYIGDIYSKKKPAGGIFIQGNMRTDIVYTVPVKGTNWFVNAHENINAIANEIKQLRFRYILGALLFGILIAISASITARRISRGYEKQIERKNAELEELNHTISQQKDEISAQLDVIAAKNKEITDSIYYAEKIQSAVLPSLADLQSIFPESFVLYKPKDIISGDFYWFGSVGNNFVLVAADCTGHGVPGAFMSMLGITLLNEIVNHHGTVKADAVLNELRNQVKASLGQTGSNAEQKDGMDIALCIIDSSAMQIQYAGAFNPLYLIRLNEQTNTPELSEIKADRMPIGVYPKDKQPFKNNLIQLHPNDSLYLFSDGFNSQFGGEKGDTFKSKRFQELLLSAYNQPMKKQKEVLETSLRNWQGNFEQVDDILVIGLKI